MTEMTLEQVRDELREWGKVDHSPLCVNCKHWADAIDAALQSRAQDRNGARIVDIYEAYKTWPQDIRAKLSLHDLRRMNGWAPQPDVGETMPTRAVTDEMVECASEAYDDVYTAEITANTSADNKHQAIRAALEAALESRAQGEAPGMTDLMVPPESIDSWLENNPLPAAAVTDSRLQNLVRNLRHRAETGEQAHGSQWCSGVRFAANELEAALAAPAVTDDRPTWDALELAHKFHDEYERLAPAFGYETRKETRAFNPDSDNGRLMIAVCDRILAEYAQKAATAGGRVE